MTPEVCQCISSSPVAKPAIFPMLNPCWTVFTFPPKEAGPASWIADKGYNAESLRQYCDRYRMQPVIPYRSMKRKPKPGLPRLFDKSKYRERNVIERLFGWLKEHRPLDDTLLQAREKLCRHGHVSLLAAMSTTVLFVQCLSSIANYLPASWRSKININLNNLSY